MASKLALIEEIKNLPQDMIDDVYHYVTNLKQFEIKSGSTMLASEQSLAKDWLLPEEDEAWANL